MDNDFYSDERVKRQVRLLIKHNFDVHVLCYHSESRTNLEKSLNKVEIHALRVNKKLISKIKPIINLIPLYEYFWAYQIQDFIRKTGVEVIHVHDLYMSKAGFLGKRMAGIPMILDLHEHYPAAILTYNWAIKFPNRLITLPKRWKSKESKYLSYANKTIVLSESYNNRLVSAYSHLAESDFFTLPNVPDLDYFDKLTSAPIPELVKAGDIPTLVYFGVIAERRGIFEVLHALKLLIESKFFIHVLLIGPVDNADRKRFLSATKDESINRYITYIPWIDMEELSEYLKQCDVAICPIKKNDQHESGIANKVFQYLLYEKPIIVSNCKPQEELVQSHDVGAVYESGDIEDLKITIVNMLSEPSRLKEMGENGESCVRSIYNLNEFGKSFIAFYREFLR